MDSISSKLAINALRHGIANDQELDACMSFIQYMLEKEGMKETKKLLSQLSPKNLTYFPLVHTASVVHFHCGDFDTAAQLLETCARMQPSDAELHNDLGQALRQASRIEDAVQAFQRAVALRPGFVDALSNLGNTYAAVQRHEEAEACFEKALQIEPRAARVLYNFGALKLEANDYTAAARLTAASLDAGYAHIDALANLSVAQMQLGDWQLASRTLAAGSEVNPTSIAYLLSAAMLADKMHDTRERDALVTRGLEMDPANGDALLMRVQALNDVGDYEAAIEIASSAQLSGKHRVGIMVSLYYARQWACVWDEGLASLSAEIDRIILDNPKRGIEPPLQTTSRTADAMMTLRSAEAWAAPMAYAARSHDRLTQAPVEKADKRIRIGYVSFDFRDHAISHLIHRIFGLHDRTAFEVICFAANPDDGSLYRQKIANGTDAFHSIHGLGAVAASKLISEQRIDILIDLNGHTKGTRLDVFAFRPAPVSVSWLGFPGTTGAGFIDYVIADPIVCMPGDEACFSEALILMPDTYQCADTEDVPPAASRADAELPSDAVVMACMNQAYKIEQVAFDHWLAVMGEHPQTVLWLLEQSPAVEHRLRSYASNSGVAPSRLIFAPKLEKKHHLARLRAADFSLDTLTYNGHTTTRDSIICGLPVVSILGSHFPSRVSASLLTAYGLGDLVQSDAQGYLALAHRFASDDMFLAATKERIVTATSSPRLTSAAFVQSLETAYKAIWNRHINGESPSTLFVDKGLPA